MELLRGSHFFFPCLYLERMSCGAKVMDIVLWATGKSLLLAKDLGLVQLPPLDKLIKNPQCQLHLAIFSRPSVIYCRTFLQPELQRFCTLDLPLNHSGLVSAPDEASTNKSALVKQCAENCACGGTNESATFMCRCLSFSCMFLRLVACVLWSRRLSIC